ncbi:hypothetical protein NHX12_007685 [Muraenolepis orangiensis]|uniref:Uncharacterized protein n=1 Tax=Muraenolepis orangiensis TaxID=630683 RepID=A0A9Q0IC92_9TELE|nr:hypothetical protein NHX12_007685 [Muraenolepis orangiensis]
MGEGDKINMGGKEVSSREDADSGREERRPRTEHRIMLRWGQERDGEGGVHPETTALIVRLAGLDQGGDESDRLRSLAS